MLEVIAAVKRVAGVDFAVRHAARRPGDSIAVVADVSRIHATLDWTPKFDDLDTIARHALQWEQKMLDARAQAPLRAASA